ncbi:MAG: flagellar assembly protein FliW [Candidatus Paracaedibacteraceae bacterium]|nr:flagellar assembly protein FliW [Candidatus Paracaedibacteraceae bacterium]
MNCETLSMQMTNSHLSERRVIMPQGIIGFGDIQHYLLAPLVLGEGTGLFWELQSVEDRHTSFILMSLPQLKIGNTTLSEVDLATAIRHLGITPDDIEIYLIISIEVNGKGEKTVTANIRAPFIFHPASNRGWQVVLSDPKYPMAQII